MKRNIHKIGNRQLQRQIQLAFTKYQNSKKSMDQFFGCKIVKAMRQRTDEYTIKTKKIDTKTVIIYGDSKHPDDYYFGKDLLNIKSFEPIAVEANTLMHIFGKPSIDLENEYMEHFNIYQLKEIKDKNGKKRTVGFLSRLVPGIGNGSINIGVYDWPTTDVFWLPSQNLINNSFMCTKSENCFYTCNTKKDIAKHEKRCTDVQKIISKQVEYGNQSDEASKLSHIMDFDFTKLRQRHFCCFDIETFTKNDVCIPVSIAVASTLDGPKYYEKADDSPEAGYEMVCEFIDYLLDLQQQLLDNLEPDIERAISFLQAEKEGLLKSKKCPSKAAFNQMENYFKNFQVLKVFGFNSRYCKL